MLSKLRIGHRLLLLIGVQAAVLMAMGLAALLFRGYATNTIVTLNEHVQEQVKLSHVSDAIRADMIGTINGINRGTITWKQARQDLARANTEFNRAWSALGNEDPALTKGVMAFRQVFADLGKILGSENRAQLSLYVLNDLEPNIAPFVNALKERVTRQHAQSRAR